MNSPHLAKTPRTAPPGLQSGKSDLPSGWKQYANPAHGLTFRCPAGWSIARQANYLFLSSASEDPCSIESDAPQGQLVLDLTPIHLYPYQDLKEYLVKTHKRSTPATEAELRALSGGYLSCRLSRPTGAGKNFFLFYIGKGNLAYTLTVSGKELLATAEQILASVHFR